MMDSLLVPSYLKKIRSVKWDFIYDEKNFLYCVIRHLWPETNKFIDGTKIPRAYFDKLNLKGIKFPFTYPQIASFVKKNKHLALTIRIFFESEKQVCVLDTFSNVAKGKRKTTPPGNILNLLLMKSDDDYKAANPFYIKSESLPQTLTRLRHTHHFFTISRVRAFLNNRKNNLCFQFSPDKKINFYNYYYCETCLLEFRSKKKKNRHEKICQRDKQSIEYPRKGDYLNFTKRRNCFKAPVIGFADFECFLKPVTKEEEQSQQCVKCQKQSHRCDCDISANVVLNNHRACGYSICFVDSENDVFFQETYSGEDAVQVFLDKMDNYHEIVQKRKQRFRKTDKIIATQSEWFHYHQQTICHICKEPFKSETQLYRKVPDHDHVTGRMVGAAHLLCNLQRQGPYLTPIYFHNAQG